MVPPLSWVAGLGGFGGVVPPLLTPGSSAFRSGLSLIPSSFSIAPFMTLGPAARSCFTPAPSRGIAIR